MAARLYINHFSSKLTAQLLVAGTTANITAGDGVRLAGANGTDWFIGTLRRLSGFKDVAREIVKISNRSTDALTIVRAQEGTTALQFEVGDQLDIDFTATSITGGVAGSVDITNVSGSGNLNLANTTSSTTGVITKATLPFIHNFAVAGNDGANLFFGVNAGNFAMTHGAGATYLASNNIGIGGQALVSNTTGYYNNAIGTASMLSNTTGYYNSTNGNSAMLNNTTGYSNTAMGGFALQNITTGFQNAALGAYAGLVLTTGSKNTYLGFNAVALAAGDTNAISIGADAVSLGSNTTVIGNSSTTSAKIWGNLTLSGTLAASYVALTTTQTLTDAATIAWNVASGPVAKVTLGGNRTLGAPTNLVDGGTYILRVIQDGTGSRTLAYNAVFKWPGGTAPTLTATAAGIDILTFVSDGTNLYGVAQLAFA